MSRKRLTPLTAAFSGLLCLAGFWITRTNLTEQALAQNAGAGGPRRPMILDRKPLRVVGDPYPTFHGVALDEERGEVFLGNDNKVSGVSIQAYRVDFAPTDRVIEPRRRVSGPATRIGQICGLGISPENNELFFVNNDGDDNMGVLPLEANGDVAPVRDLQLPHGAWGVYWERKFDELFITVEHINQIVVYPRTATGGDSPLRMVQGPNTELADPHGIYVDVEKNEIYVANHGHWHRTETGEGFRMGPSGNLTVVRGNRFENRNAVPLGPSTGKFIPPSITVHSRAGSGDLAPLRTIQGPKTGLNFPLGIYLDKISKQIVVANGNDSVLFFDQNANGDVAPVRILKGPRTELSEPTGSFIDFKRSELWVSNWMGHSATVYPRAANGNVAPLRTIRSAPKGSPAAGFGNPGSLAYNSKRKEILVPN